MIYSAQRSDTQFELRPRGTWTPLLVGGVLEVSATFICPHCGQCAALDGHNIVEGGLVRPGVLCDCGWHADLLLTGWPPTNLGVYAS